MISRFSIDVFSLTPETAEAALGLKNLPVFFRAKIEQKPGGLQAAIAHYTEHRSPTVIIVEDDGDAAKLLSRLEGLAGAVEPGRKLIVVGAVNDVGIYRQLISMGVADYLLSSPSVHDLAASIERATHNPNESPKGKLIGFVGSRGGVGSSTIAHNVAWIAATQMQARTILVDLDLVTGTAALAFNEEPRQPLMDALAEPDRLDALLLQRFMVGESETLQILSTSGTLRSPFLVSRAAVEKLIELTRQMADIVIVDLPHLWAPWVEEVLVDADEIAITTGLDLANLRDARNLVELLRAKRGEGRSPHIVVNRADMAKRGRLTLQDANTALSTKPLAQLPFDPVAFVEAVNDGKVFADRNKKHKATLALQEIAARLTGHEKPKRRVIGFSLQGRFKRPSNTKMAST